MTYIQERGSTHVYHVNRMSKEEMDHMISLCVHEQPAYCVAACPFKMDTKEMLYYAAKGNFKKALAIYEKITPFPMILCDGCTAPCEDNCKLCELGDGVSIREVERAIVRYGEPGRRSSVFRMRKKKRAAIFGSGLFPLFLAGELEKMCIRDRSCTYTGQGFSRKYSQYRYNRSREYAGSCSCYYSEEFPPDVYKRQIYRCKEYRIHFVF